MAISATGGQTVNNTSLTSSFSFAAGTLTLGQFVVVGVSIANSNAAVSSISDTVNTYTFKQASSNTGNCRIELWTANVTAATASRTITVNMNTAGAATAAYEEYAGAVGGFGNLGNANVGFSQNPYTDVVTTFASDWGVGAFSILTNTTDTIADEGISGVARRQQLVPVSTGTVPGILVADFTSILVSVALPLACTVNVARAWASTSINLQTGTTPNTPTANKFKAPIIDAQIYANRETTIPPVVTVGSALNSGFVG